MSEPTTRLTGTLAGEHPRSFESFRYVYPVVSRRSRGVSVGVNLNPDKICNFDCVYCQVDRTTGGAPADVDLDVLSAELGEVLRLVASGEVFLHPRFSATPAEFRRLNDVAFSGDGEPTTCREFEAAVACAAEVKAELGLHAVKLVLITNATMLHRPAVRRGLEILDANQGEIWAKLEAGTEAYYEQIERTKIPLAQVLENITAVARARPVVIQSLFMRVAGKAPSDAEIGAFCERLRKIRGAGGAIDRVQVYTVARRPAESTVSALSDVEVDAIAARVAEQTGLVVERFYSAASDA